jgi:hypothetical protein
MMTTAQRSAYNRAPQPGRSSTTGLMLNFSPLGFEDKEVEARVFPYGADGDEQLKKLRNEHWATHVFRRDGPDEIVGIAVKADAPGRLITFTPRRSYRAMSAVRAFTAIV